MRQPQPPVAGRAQAGIALVGAQCVAAGRDEIDDAIELAARERSVGQRRSDLAGRSLAGSKGPAQAVPHTCCASTSSAPVRVYCVSWAPTAAASMAARHSSTSKRLPGTSKRARGFIQAMIGAADALDQTARTLRRAHIDDEVHIAPVDAQIQRRGCHHGLERAGSHGGLDLAAAGGIERAMMQGDGQAVLVRAPQFLEQQLGLAAGVHEHQRQIVGLDGRIDFGDGIARAVPGPWQRRLRLQHADVVRRAAGDRDEVGKPHRAGIRIAAPDRRAARSASPRWPTVRSARDPAPESQAAPGRAPAGRRAWWGRARAARPG